MSLKLPQVSAGELIRVLKNFGYVVIRQKGSHIRLRKVSTVGEHNITIPNHKDIAKGTLNDILVKVCLWNGIAKDELIKLIKD